MAQQIDAGNPNWVNSLHGNLLELMVHCCRISDIGPAHTIG
jgi:hypothetical protein